MLPRARKWQALFSYSRRIKVQTHVTGGAALLLGNDMPDGGVIWAFVDQAGYRYVIEKRTEGAVWRRLMVLTNQTGTVLFSDLDPPEHSMLLFRARILE